MVNSQKVYILHLQYGEYEDKDYQIVGCYNSEELAEYYKDFYSSVIRDFSSTINTTNIERTKKFCKSLNLNWASFYSLAASYEFYIQEMDIITE